MCACLVHFSLALHSIEQNECTQLPAAAAAAAAAPTNTRRSNRVQLLKHTIKFKLQMGLVYLSYALTANMSDGFHNAFIAFVLVCSCARVLAAFRSPSIYLFRCVSRFYLCHLAFFIGFLRSIEAALLLSMSATILLLIICVSLTLFPCANAIESSVSTFPFVPLLWLPDSIFRVPRLFPFRVCACVCAAAQRSSCTNAQDPFLINLFIERHSRAQTTHSHTFHIKSHSFPVISYYEIYHAESKR